MNSFIEFFNKIDSASFCFGLIYSVVLLFCIYFELWLFEKVSFERILRKEKEKALTDKK